MPRPDYFRFTTCEDPAMSDDSAEEIGEETIMAKWAEIAPLIEHMAVRIQTPNEFVVGLGSALAADDSASNPYQVSHCVQACLTAGVDHLHALKRLVIDDRLLHTGADFSLARGALENFGTAFWVLHPAEPTERITHALRWMAQDFKDQAKADEELGKDDAPSRKAKLAKVQRVADAAGCGSVSHGYSSTEVMKYAKEHVMTDPFLPWQVCSGFAHGRPWANLGMSIQERQPAQKGQEPGVVSLRLTTDYSRLLYVALPAFHLMTDVLKRFDHLSKAP
jgi:hypothetical protein